jgi:hypothetical protein
MCSSISSFTVESARCVQDLKKALELSRREFDFSYLEEERGEPGLPTAEVSTETGTVRATLSSGR